MDMEKNANEQTKAEGKNAKTFYSYDYLTVDTDLKKASQTMDYYESLGWEITGSNERAEMMGKTVLNFRRDRKIKNKDQLLRMQKKMEDAMESIEVLQKQKKSGATVLSLVIGIVGALILGIGMCMCMLNPTLGLMIGGCIVGVVGIIVCGVNYYIFKKAVSKKSAKINPIISKKGDELANFCEEAQKYLN